MFLQFSTVGAALFGRPIREMKIPNLIIITFIMIFRNFLFNFF